MTTAKDLINELVALRAERDDLDAREQFLKDQLQGAIALGELDSYETNATRSSRSSTKSLRCQKVS